MQTADIGTPVERMLLHDAKENIKRHFPYGTVYSSRELEIWIEWTIVTADKYGYSGELAPTLTVSKASFQGTVMDD